MGKPAWKNSWGKKKLKSISVIWLPTKTCAGGVSPPCCGARLTGETADRYLYVKYVYMYSQKGAPMDYVRLGKMMGDGHYVGSAARRRIPTPGKALIRFLSGRSRSMGLYFGKTGEL